MAAMKRAERGALLVALAALLGVAVVVALALVAGWPRAGTATGSASPVASLSTSPSPTSSASATPTPSPSPSPSPSVTRPPIVRDFISYGSVRRGQMAAYSQRHYGTRTWLLRPRVIVLHYTVGSTYRSARAVFASNSPNLGELPGVAAHFVIDKDGTIYQLVPLYARVRHAIGLNHRALAIEMVQEGGSGPHWADAQILARKPQMRSALRLVRYLRARYGIRLRNVIGHAMANDSPYFRDLLGWRNDHTDWLAADVRVFRARLAALR
jgi:N-acetylmuramoyl-L-alanine amidase